MWGLLIKTVKYMNKKIIGYPHFAFNVWDFESARAIIDSAAFMGQDVILQTSSDIYKAIPARVFADFVHSYAAYKGIDAWLNVDHCKEKNILLSAVDNGWDMVMADGSSLSIQDNIAFTNDIVTYAHARNVLVEAEVGQVKGIEEDIVVQQDTIASKSDIMSFINCTGIDFIAVAFGNAHGKYKVKPNLHYDLVEYTVTIADKPFVVHGGSGLSDETLEKLLSIKGVKKINISTELKMAYKKGVERAIKIWSQPIKVSNTIHDEIMNVAISKMKILNSGGFFNECTSFEYGNEEHKKHHI